MIKPIEKKIALSRLNSLKDILNFCVNNPREARNKHLNETLCLLFQTYPYFKNLLANNKSYGHLMYYSIIKNLIFKEKKKDEPICKCNEVISSMLILISGTAKVYKPPQKYKKNKSKGGGLSKLTFLLKNLISAEMCKELDYIVTEGNVLGNEDITKVAKRPRLIEAKTDCIIGELPLTDYTLIFERTQLLEKTSISHFLENLKIFTHVKKSFINIFQEMLTKRIYNKNDQIIRRGDPYKTFYIVRKGLFQLSLKTTKKFINTMDLSCFTTNIQEALDRFYTQRKFELKNSYEEFCEYKIVNLGFGELIGQIEYKLGLAKYFFDVKCQIDNSELLEVNIDMLKCNSSKMFLNSLDAEIVKQMEFIQNRIDQIKAYDKKKGNKNKYISAIIDKIDKKKSLSLSLQKNKHKANTTHKKQSNNVIYKVCVQKINTTRNERGEMDFLSTNYTNTNTPKKCKKTLRLLSSSNSKKKQRNKSINIIGIQTEIRPYTSKYNSRDEKNRSLFHNSIISSSSLEKTNIYPYLSPIKSNSSILNQPHRLLSENNKLKYSKCFEVNKNFFLKNNTSILSHKLESIFCK